METSIIQQLLVLLGSFLFIAFVAAALRRGGVVPRETAHSLNAVIINATVPALVITSVLKADLRPELALLPLVAVATAAIVGTFAWAAGRVLGLRPELQGGFILAAAQGNTAYLGYPIIFALFGAGGLIEGVFFDYGVALTILTAGAAVARHYGTAKQERSLLQELIAFPPLLALPVGLLLGLFPLPKFLTEALELLGSATIPLVMFSIGLTLTGHGLTRFTSLVAGVGLLKLAVSPVIAFSLLLLAAAAGLIEPGRIVTVATAQAGMPTGMLTVVFALRYGLDEHFLSAAVLITTIASLVTLPFLIAITH